MHIKKLITLTLLCMTATAFANPLPLTAAHRGMRNLVQENTLESIQLSIEHHVDIMDLDTIVTKYGDIVCTHDEDAKDYVEGHQSTMIREMTRNEIKNLNLAKDIMGNTYDQTRKFAFLDEVFNKIDLRKIIIWIDIKERTRSFSTPHHDAEVYDAFLQQHKNQLNRVIISGTNPFVILQLVTLAKQHGYFNQLTIGFDYGFNNPYFESFALTTQVFEKKYGLNFVAAGKELLTQDIIDQNPNIKFMPYTYNPDETPTYKHIFGYLVDY